MLTSQFPEPVELQNKVISAQVGRWKQHKSEKETACAV